MVFAECGLGAIVLTINGILLGGELVFFQSLCLLGYCLFPQCVSAIVCTFMKIVVSEGGKEAPCNPCSTPPCSHSRARRMLVALLLQWVRVIVLAACLLWSSLATIPFIGNAVPRE